MKFSENWLREFVDFDISTAQLVDELTMAGLEVDAVEPVAADFEGIVVGEILEVSVHPDADKLVVCSVSSGDEQHQVVCGAPNARPGIRVPYARVGARLPDLKIRKAKLRGVESSGMLCSERELGLSDSHEGLMELAGDAPVGTDIRDYLGLNDNMIELDLTPNRADCFGMLGVGRETALIARAPLKSVEIDAVPATIEDVFGVELAAGEACPRFAGRVIRGIDLDAETPLWMKEKLRRSGIRSIDPVVDVTNFVMMELGQPMHAYDLDRLSGKIVVRMSRAGDKVKLLDGSEVELQPETLLITDDSGPIGMAGIMGGESTMCTASTANIFLESAFFAPTAIAGKARAYGMHTDASHRFERGVDWQQQARAIERATRLLLEIAGGDAGPTVETVDETSLPEQRVVRLRASRIERLLGVSIPDEDIEAMLERLHFPFDRDTEAGTWLVTAPSHRFDIAIEADLIEEIARVYGYNTLPVKMPNTRITMIPSPEARLAVDVIKDQFVARGYQEAVTYSFVDHASQRLLDPENEPIGLTNPISSEMSVMRTTCWPGLIKSLHHNLNRQQSRVRLFEIGLRFLRSPNQAELTMDSIRQEQVVSGVVCGPVFAESWGNDGRGVDFFDVKGDLESLIRLTGAADEFRFEALRHPALHPGQSAAIRRGDQVVGLVGLLDPRAEKALDLDRPVYLFEILMDALREKRLPGAITLSKFPEVRRDIAVLVDQTVPAQAVRDTVFSAAGEALTNLKLFDVYQGKGIDPNRKSLALGLTFQHPSRTLTDKDTTEFVDAIVAALANELGASLRN